MTGSHPGPHAAPGTTDARHDSARNDDARHDDDRHDSARVAADAELADEAPPLHYDHRWTFTAMLVSSLLSLVASFVLSVDAVRLAADPDVALGCNINEAISCGKVAQAWQASLLGFPNAFLGLITEPVVITIAVAGLARVRFPHWFTIAAQVVYLIGLLFAYWLFVQSYFVIDALCPWCLVVTASTTTVFTSLLRYNIRENTFRLSPALHERLTGLLRIGLDYALVAAWFIFLGAAIVLKYQHVFFR